MDTQVIDRQTQQTAVTQPAGQTPVEPQTAGVQTDAAKPNAGWDYKSDPRWGKVWKAESDIINGYKSLDDILETKYKPTFKQYEELAKLFKSNNLDIEQVGEYIKEYQGLKSPDHAPNQLYKFLQELVADDDLSAQELDLAIQKLQEDKLSRKYPGLNKEAREKVIQQEKQLKELNSWKQSIEQEKLNKTAEANVQKGMDSIKKLCDDRGFEFTDKLREEFLSYCIENQVPASYMYQEFRAKYDTELDKTYTAKIKAATIEEANKNNKQVVTITKPSIGSPKNANPGFMDKLTNAMKTKTT